MSTKTPLPTVNEKATESVSMKGLFVGRVSSKLAQLLRHCIRLSVKVHPEGGLVVVDVFPPNLLRISGVLCCLPALFFHTWCSTLLMNRKQAYSQRQTRHWSLFITGRLAFRFAQNPSVSVGLTVRFNATAGNWDGVRIFRPDRRRHNYSTLLADSGRQPWARFGLAIGSSACHSRVLTVQSTKYGLCCSRLPVTHRTSCLSERCQGCWGAAAVRPPSGLSK